MAKIRSKLKRNANGKTWKRGYSSVSNPTQMKHRQMANKRFFQQNLSTGKLFQGFTLLFLINCSVYKVFLFIYGRY